MLSHGGLVGFDGQQKVGAVLEHQLARGLVLGVQGVEADFAPVQIEFLEPLARDGDFIGLGVHQGAAQVVLAGHGEGRQHGMTAALAGLLAIQDDQFILGGRAADLVLQREEDFFQRVIVDMLHHPAKGRLAGRWESALGLPANAQRAALRLAEAFGEEGQVFLTARRAAPMGQHANGNQTPQRINADARTVIGQGLEVLDERADLRGGLGAARARFGLDPGQRGFEFVGGQTASGVPG